MILSVHFSIIRPSAFHNSLALLFDYFYLIVTFVTILRIYTCMQIVVEWHSLGQLAWCLKQHRTGLHVWNICTSDRVNDYIWNSSGAKAWRFGYRSHKGNHTFVVRSGLSYHTFSCRRAHVVCVSRVGRIASIARRAMMAKGGGEREGRRERESERTGV